MLGILKDHVALHREKIFSATYQLLQSEIEALITGFKFKGERLDNGNRNTIKLFKIGDDTFNVKAFNPDYALELCDEP